jgi:hypothetical protein
MLDRGREPIEGRVWFVSHIVTVGRWVTAPLDDDDLFFSYVVNDLGLGATPAVLYDPRDPGPELRVYPNGLGDAETVEKLHIANTDIDISDVYARISAIHKHHLVTPGAQHRGTRVWEDAAHERAVTNAEDVLGGLIAAGLQAAYPMCIVRIEQTLPVGRLDIEIEERLLAEPGVVKRHAVLELKVLRGRNPGGTAVSKSAINKMVHDGVVQAAAYRDDKEALAAALCCFDMRREFHGAQCFAKVTKLASELAVETWSWHLFNTAAAYRKHRLDSGSLGRGMVSART